MGVVDVEPGAVGEDGVDQTRVDLGKALPVEPEASGITAGRLLLERPLHPGSLPWVRVDHQARCQRRVEVRLVADDDPVLGLGPEHLVDGHDQAGVGSLKPCDETVAVSHKYCPVVTASMARASSSPSISVRT